MKQRLIEAKNRREGIDFEVACEQLGVRPDSVSRTSVNLSSIRSRLSEVSSNPQSTLFDVLPLNWNKMNLNQNS